ncbi:MAG: hypothetical protein ACI9FG_001564 [Crocinitomicaceae bacterium]|jgi:hypothetical protein
MIQFLKSLSILALLTLGLGAELPKNPSMSDYDVLKGRSPFMIKKPPAPIPKAPIINNSLTLRGVSMFDDGWFVTVVDRKNTKEPIFLREGAAPNSKGLKLIKVDKNIEDYLQTTVIVMNGLQKMTIGYNSTDIKNGIAKASRVTSKPRTTNRPTSTKKPQVPTSSTSTRRPRVRRTPTPPVKRSK